MGQVHEVVNILRINFIEAWKLKKFPIVNKMMIQYKGSYFLACQYVLKKPPKWGIKVWCLVDAKSKFVYNFNIYCGRNGMKDEERDIDGQLAKKGEPKLANNVVMKLIEGNERKEHYILMDNFFQV